MIKKRAGGIFRPARSVRKSIAAEIICQQLVHKLVSVYPAYKASCVIVVRDVRRILGEDISDQAG